MGHFVGTLDGFSMGDFVGALVSSFVRLDVGTLEGW